jgi:hypothetical protein
MRRAAPVIILAMAALNAAPTAAQTPPPASWPSYPAVKAHIESHTVEQLSAEVFGASPPDTFVRAGGVQSHPGRWGSVTLWTRPQVVETRASGPIRGVCRIRHAYATMRSLEPPSFGEPTVQWLYKTLPRNAGAPETAYLADDCARIDPRLYDYAQDPAIVGDAMGALYALVAEPRSADLRLVSCEFGRRSGPLCGMKPDDVLTRSVSAEVGDCQTLARTRFRDRVPSPGFPSGRCYFFQSSSNVGFWALITADAPRPSAAFTEVMSLGYSPSFLADQQ